MHLSQCIDSRPKGVPAFSSYPGVGAFFILVGLPSIVAAESLRCGSRSIERGSSSAELTAFCGDPAQVSRSTLYGGEARAGRDGVITGSSGELEVEVWTYNFGPDQLMERVRIENGVVVQIDSLGYGYNEP